MTYPAWLDLTPEQRKILVDRARKHRAVLHNQPIQLRDFIEPGMVDHTEAVQNAVNAASVPHDTRVEESEIILDTLLRRYAIIGGDEQIEEIAAVEVTDEPWDQTPAHLCIMTNLQVIELPYTLNDQGI